MMFCRVEEKGRKVAIRRQVEKRRMWSETLVRIEEIAGRGRAIVSSQPLRGGDIVLRDSPILLYSAFPLNKSSVYCENCFRKLESAVISCPTCSHHQFCSPNCVLGSSHTPWVCQALSRLRHCVVNQPLDRQVQARFLIAAYNLFLNSPSNFQILLSLHGEGGGRINDDEDAQFLHSRISSLCPPTEGFPFFSLELTSALLAKDKLNAFGLMEPFHLNDEKRSVRAYGIYPKASLFNHDCLPNACRFDYVDTHNTHLIIRMIHDVPQGREICLSYFPVNYNYSTRQNRLLDDYGFNCDCDRCKVEANWSDQEHDGDDDDVDQNENENVAMEDDPDEPMADDEEENAASGNFTDFPHAYFFLRYMCNHTNCWGTLAPLPTSNHNTTLLECNVCGNIKTDDADGGQGSLSTNH